MKTRFLLPLAFFLFTSIARAQINKAKHYESILKLTIESFSNSEITKLTTILKLDDNQERTIITLVADYYSELKRIDNDRQAKQINNLRRTVEWNFAEHNYLHKIEVLLSNQQKSLLRNTFYTLKKEKFAFRIFSRAELQQTCNIL